MHFAWNWGLDILSKEGSGAVVRARAVVERGGVVWGGAVVASVPRLGVHRCALVLHVRDEAALVVRAVGHDLDAAVRERHAVLARHHSVLVLHLLLSKVRAGVGVLHRKS